MAPLNILRLTPNSGLYIIQNKINNKFYIGSSENVKEAFKYHKRLSTWKNHPNHPLYKDMLAFGVENFDFRMYKESEPKDFKQRKIDAIAFLKPEYNVRSVRGIDVGDGYCIDANIADAGKEVLVATEKSYGKRTTIDEYRITHRGSKGVKTLNTTEKTGNIVAFKIVNDQEDLMIITNSGMVIRIPISQISVMSRVTQGVRLISLKENQLLTAVFNIPKEDVTVDENIEKDV